MKVYVVDNGGQWTHREWRVLKYLGVDTKIVANNTDPGDLAKERIDGLVLSGGAPRVGLADTLGRCGEFIDTLKVPIMGICAGHQFMARHFGGVASPGADGGEFGATTITLHEPEPKDLFKGVPKSTTVWESHHDEVSTVPQGFEVLASSERCKVQAMRHRSRPLYGVQFHPEVEHTQYGAAIFQNFLEVCRNETK